MKEDLRRRVGVFYSVTIVAATVGAVAVWALGGIEAKAAGLAVALVMWAPALGRLVTVRTVDVGWTSPLPMRGAGRWRIGSMLIPLGVALFVYGGAYLIAWLVGWVSFQPAWPAARIAVHLAVNIPLLVVIMGVGSIGEELGWRGYLQPRLDEAGVRYAVVWVGLMWFLFHLPIMLIGGYQHGEGSFGVVLLLFAVGCVTDAVVWTWACYRQKSLWPAIWFHTFHNLASQWLFPKFFPVADGDLLLGESGILPTALHVLAAVLVLLLTRHPQAALAGAASTTARGDPSTPPGPPVL